MKEHDMRDKDSSVLENLRHWLVDPTRGLSDEAIDRAVGHVWLFAVRLARTTPNKLLIAVTGESRQDITPTLSVHLSARKTTRIEETFAEELAKPLDQWFQVTLSYYPKLLIVTPEDYLKKIAPKKDYFGVLDTDRLQSVLEAVKIMATFVSYL